MTPERRASLEYLERVEAFFLARRGRGLMLSPADAQLLRELEEAGVPVEVVCRGVARAFETRDRRGSQPPRSIQGCWPFIEQVVAEWRSRELGRNRWDPAAERAWVEARLGDLLARIEAAGRSSTGPALSYHRRAWAAVRERLAAVRTDPVAATRAVQDLATLEKVLLGELFAALTPEEARALEDRAAARVSLRREVASERAWSAAVEAAREEELRATFDLVPLTLGDF